MQSGEAGEAQPHGKKIKEITLVVFHLGLSMTADMLAWRPYGCLFVASYMS